MSASNTNGNTMGSQSPCHLSFSAKQSCTVHNVGFTQQHLVFFQVDQLLGACRTLTSVEANRNYYLSSTFITFDTHKHFYVPIKNVYVHKMVQSGLRRPQKASNCPNGSIKYFLRLGQGNSHDKWVLDCQQP